MVALEWVYLDNERYLHDPQTSSYTRDGTTLDIHAVRRKKMHAAHLRAVTIGQKLYYMDERLKEFRRIGNPADRMTYDEFDRLVDKGVTLEIPKAPRFRRMMVAERALVRKLTDPEADNDAAADNDRG